MSREILAELFTLTNQLQQNEKFLINFRDWVKINKSELTKFFSPGEILRFLHGSIQEILHSTLKIKNDCQFCSILPIENLFSSRGEFELFMKYIENLVNKNIFISVSQPNWFKSTGEYAGAEGFFKCTFCDGLWQTTLPEKEHNGTINRIA
jgi:hypothetical protein